MAAREGRVLWEPPEELLRDSKMARYMRDRGFDSYDELWRWSVDDLEGFWRSIWDSVRGRPVARARAGEHGDAGRGVVPGHAAQLRRAALPRRARGRGRARPRERVEPACRAVLGRAGRRGGALRGRPAPAGSGARRPGGRLHAERGRDGDRVPGDREHRRDLVELRAGVRHADGGRPLRADRAEGADRHRGLPLRRARLRPPRARARDRAGPADARAHRDGAVRTGTSCWPSRRR